MSSENIRGNVKTTGTQLVLGMGGNTTTVAAGSPAASIVLTLPAAPSGNASTLVDTNSTQTLSGKTFTAPVLGAATATSINKVVLTAPATSATLTIADGKTLTASASITLTGTDGSALSLAANLTTSGANALTLTTTGATNVTLPTSGTLATTSNKLSDFFYTTSAELAGIISDGTGSGALVLGTSPTLVTPLVTTSLDASAAGAFALLASVGANNITVGGASSTVVIAGNLEVQGTTTTLNTATLDVEDVNITINNSGTNGSANGAGLTVEKGWDASTDSALVWDTTGKKFKMGQAGSEIELVDLSSSQALTGKTYSGLTISSTTGTLTVTNGKTLSVSNTATIAGADDTGTLTLAAGAQVVGGNTNNNDIVTKAGTQTLTNKTLTSPSLTTPSVDVMTLDGQASAPSNPSSGFYKTYVSDGDGKLHILDSGGNDTAVGSGSSGRNYLSDWFDAAKDIGTVTNSLGNTLASSDRTANKTTWGSSNTSLLTIARSASSPLRQSYSYLITEAGASLDAFVESPLFSLDSVDLGKPVTVSFDVADNAASDDYQVYICRYDSNDVLQERIVVAGTASAVSPYSARLPTGTTKFQGFFVASSTSTDQYALRIVSNSSSAASIKVDSLYVGPEKVVQGAGISDWVSYSPTLSNSTNNTVDYCMWRKSGQNMEIIGAIAWSGAGAGGNFSISIPSGYSVDTSILLNNGKDAIGSCSWLDNGTAYKNLIPYLIDGNIRLKEEGTTNIWDSSQAASSDYISFQVSIPIAGWSSNVTMADRAVEEYASNSSTAAAGTWDSADTTSFAYGAAGSLIYDGALTSSRKKRVRFQTPILPTDKLEIELYDGACWVPAIGARLDDADAWNIPPYSYLTAANDAGAMGIGFVPVSGSSTDIDVIFGRYMTGYNTGTPTGVAWSAMTGGVYWRVRKVSGGAAVGYPIGARNIVGDTTGTAVPSGIVGEVIYGSTIASNISVTTNSTAISSITLTPGRWALKYNVCAYASTGATSGNRTYINIRIRDSGDTTTIPGSIGIVYAKTVAAVANAVEANIGKEVIVDITANTTYLLRGIRIDQSGSGSANVHNNGQTESSEFYAVRIA